MGYTFFLILACIVEVESLETRTGSVLADEASRSLRSLLLARAPVGSRFAHHGRQSVAERPYRVSMTDKFDVKELAGVTEPLGFFDPVGFTEGKSEGKIRFYREVEIKHVALGCLRP